MRAAPRVVRREFFASLHGLRGVAVLYVVASHLGNNGLLLLPIAHDAIGKVGVWIFFALSAFLLTTNLSCDLVDANFRGASLLKYAIQRVFRIYPLYVFVLLVHLVVGNISGEGAVLHLLLIQGWAELWAISVEFQYYIFIPVISFASVYFRFRVVLLSLIAVLAAAVICGWMWPSRVFSNGLEILPKMAPFLLGSILALAVPRLDFLRARGASFLIGIASAAGLLLVTVLFRSLFEGGIDVGFAPLLSLGISGAAVGLIFAVLKEGFFASVFGAAPLVFLGRISFSLYLLHMFVIRAMQEYFDTPSRTVAWLALGVSIACAAASYWAIERPGIRAGRAISQRLEEFARHRRQRFAD